MTRSKLAAIALGLGLWFVCVEAVSYFVGRLLQSRWAMYTDPVMPAERAGAELDYAGYLARRDPLLGWPFPAQIGQDEYEANGALVSPANAELAQAAPLVSLYGDSYTQSRNVPIDEAWDVRLARRLERRVDNFGVGGYGSDQALLRFRTNRHDRAPIVILGHMSEDVLRNLTRYRDFQNYAQWFSFKPRFVAGADGGIVHVPIPHLDPAEYERFLGRAEPPLRLDHELFHPGGPSGAVRLEFPFSAALLRNTGYWRFRVAVQSRLDGVKRPDYAPFYEPDHPFRGLDVTAGILASFEREARRRGQRPLVLLFPSPDSLAYRRATGDWTYQPLVDALRERGVEALDFGEVLESRFAGRPVDSLYRSYHFVGEVYEALAEEVERALAARGWLDASEIASAG